MPELLLFPGMAQDVHAYDAVGIDGAQTYVYPGHGDREPRAATLDELADEAVRGRGDGLDLVGVALGGIVAQHVIARHPGKVRSAVLANTPGGVSDRARLVDRANETAAHGPQIDELLARWLRSSTVEAGGPEVGYLRGLLEAISWDGLANIQRAMADHDIVSVLEGDLHPVTFVVGEDDHVGVGATERLAELFVTRRMRRIPGGHMVHLDNPEEFREVIAEHVDWVDTLERTADRAGSKEGTDG